MADPGEGPGGALFLDQTEARRAEKKILDTGPPLPSSQGLDPALQTAGLRWCNKLKSLDSQKVQEYLSCSQSNGLECCNFRAI